VALDCGWLSGVVTVTDGINHPGRQLTTCVDRHKGACRGAYCLPSVPVTGSGAPFGAAERSRPTAPLLTPVAAPIARVDIPSERRWTSGSQTTTIPATIASSVVLDTVPTGREGRSVLSPRTTNPSSRSAGQVDQRGMNWTTP
jgi:hypothetical protein